MNEIKLIFLRKKHISFQIPDNNTFNIKMPNITVTVFQKFRQRFSKCFTMKNLWTLVFIFTLRNPHFLERIQRCKN